MTHRILFIDNYDSFTYNLVHLIHQSGDVDLTVRRNDEDFLTEVRSGAYDAAIIGPGPGSPEDETYFGHCKQLILEHGTAGFPILGVCLGFQGIYHAFGGALKVCDQAVHGKISQLDIKTPGTLLAGVLPKTEVMRYHSIMADLDSNIPEELECLAFAHPDLSISSTNGSELMAFEHKNYPIFGVQFHPESFATDLGSLMIRNFLSVI